MQADGVRREDDDDVQVVVELGATTVWVTLVTPSGPRAPEGLLRAGASGRVSARVAVDEDGTWSWGVDRAAEGFEVVLGGFLSRVEDSVPLVIGGVGVPGADLVARQLEHVIGVVSEETGQPSLVTVVHPDDLTTAGVGRIAAALSLQVPVRWVSRAQASIAAGRCAGDLHDGDVVASLHVGGTSCAATVWSVAANPRRLAPARTESTCAGTAIDDRIVAHVLSAGARTVDTPHVSDLRDACREAKVVLSGRTSTDLDVGGVTVRLVRTELEEISAPVLDQQLDILADALKSAGLDAASLRTVLLTGGAATAPSVVEGIGVRFDAPARVVGRQGVTVEHDRSAAAVFAERLIAMSAQQEGTRRPGLAGLLEQLSTRLSTPRLRLARLPVPVAVAAVLALVLAATGAALSQGSVVGALASALGSGEGPAGLAARSLAIGPGGTLLSLLPKVPDPIREAIQKTADTVTDTVTGGDDDPVGVDPDSSEPTPGETPTGSPGASSATTPPAPGATPSQPGKPATTAPGSTPSSAPTTTSPAPAPTTQPTDDAPDPNPVPSSASPEPEVTPDPTTPQPDPTTPQPDPTTPQPDPTTPQPDPTTPQPDPTPEPDPQPDPSPDTSPTSPDPDPTEPAATETPAPLESGTSDAFSDPTASPSSTDAGGSQP